MAAEPRVEHRQRAYRVRLEWGVEDTALLAAECAAVVVVDVLSFCTSVDIAVGRGAAVLPQRYDDLATAGREAAAHNAVPAGSRHGGGPSLRPSSLVGPAAGAALPHGATLCATVAASGRGAFAGCPGNASAIAAAALDVAGDGAIGLVPTGERWPGGTLRVAVEDAIGAGVVAAALTGDTLSPEAASAVTPFRAARERGPEPVLAATASGQELTADWFGADVTLAAAHDSSAAAPRLRNSVLTA